MYVPCSASTDLESRRLSDVLLNNEVFLCSALNEFVSLFCRKIRFTLVEENILVACRSLVFLEDSAHSM